MANNIKGITVEIGGNTEPLQKALGDVNKKSSDLQKELTAVNKNLKFNPTDTVMLSQKQRVLAESISNTKDKLATLKEAEKQAQQQFKEGKISEEQYRALQREISKTENQLRLLERQYNTTGNAASAGFEKASKGLKKVSDVSGKVYKAGKTASIGVLAIGAASVKMSMDLDTGMAKLNSLTGQTGKDADKMKQSIIDLSNQTGVSVTEITEQMYQSVSAGQSVGDSLSFVKNNITLAKTGFTDLASAVDLSSTVLNSYGLESKDLNKVTNTLLITQDKGKTTVDELSKSMGSVSSTANMYKVNVEQVADAYAVLTKNGINTQESGTAINGMLLELGKSGTTASDVLKAKTGKSFTELMASGSSLTDVLGILQGAASESGKTLGDIFSNKNAIKGAQTLSNNTKDFTDNLQLMNSNADISQDKLSKLNTNSVTFGKALNELKNTGVKIGDALAPAISKIAEKAKELADKLSHMSDAEIINIIKGGALIVGITGAAGAISKVTGALSSVTHGISKIIEHGPAIMGAIGSIKGAVSGLFSFILANPIVLVIAGIIALIIVLWNKCEWFRDAVTAVFNAIKEAFTIVVDFIKAHWEQAWEVIKLVFAPFIIAFQLAFEVIRVVFETVTGFFKNNWSTIWGGIKAILSPFADFFKGVFDRVKSAFTTVTDFFKSHWSTIWNGIKTVIFVIISPIIEKFNLMKSIFTGVSDFMKSHWDGICSGIKSAWDGITAPFRKVIDAIKSAWSKLDFKLPHIKLPHFSITGEFSLSPPSIPHLDIDWYSQGAIFNKRSLLGNIGVGDKYNGNGDNPEAVLPLDSFYDKLENIIKTKSGPTNIYLDSELISQYVDGRLVNSVRRAR